MAVRRIEFGCFSITASNCFENILAAIEAAVGHPEMTAFREDMAAAKTYAELKKVVEPAKGLCRLTEFIRFDLGTIQREQPESEAHRNIRPIIGNPLVMMQMTEQCRMPVPTGR